MFNKRTPLIYIVDKNASYCRLIAGYLNEIGQNNLRLFESGELCFTSKLPKADLVILDYDLGEGNWNGIEFMEEYERLNKNASFLFMSSNTKVEIAVKCIQRGAIDYIMKSKTGLTRLISQVEKLNTYPKLGIFKRRNWSLLFLSPLINSAISVAISIAYLISSIILIN
jgi:DNA-binding NtrC family response regulator